ncbi:MAG TPA: universal stress protein [Dermatophilaceae bacterium]|nr:universal stress protein [Dermatophilaceae bacterium]
MSVLVATNGSPEGRAAMQAGLHEALLRGTDVLYLNLADTPLELSADVPVQVTELPRDPDAHPADALLDAAVFNEVSLIVVGTRRRSAVGKLILGSTVQQILLEASVPVLSVKADYVAPR